MKKYQLSSNVRVVTHGVPPIGFVYHTLFGNPRLMNNEGLRFIDVFREPRTIPEVIGMCDENPTELIEELMDLSYFIIPGEDEYEIVHRMRDEHLNALRNGITIDRMGLAISDSCNFGCTHCIHFQPTSNGNILPPYRAPKPMLNMSWTTANRCIDHYVEIMRQRGQQTAKVHFGNAEPLINWPVIAQVLGYCASIDDLKFEFSINTNLALMSQEIAEAFKRYHVRIATSLDGMKQANDRIRLHKGGRGTFLDIVAKFDLLAEIGYPLDGFSITVTDKNFELVDESIVDFAAERGMSSLAFDYDLVALASIPVSDRVKKLMRLKQYANCGDIDFFGTWDSPFRNLTNESLLTSSYAFCAAVEGRSLEFSVDGSIRICGHTTTKIGHVTAINQLFHAGGKFETLVADRFPCIDAHCRGCIIEGACGGQCHVTREVTERIESEKQSFLFEDMCNFYRDVTEALMVDYICSGGAQSVSNQSHCQI